MSKKYTEIFRLRDMLEKENIDHEFYDESLFGMESYQIIVRNIRNMDDDGSITRLVSAVEGFRSYGNEEDLLEVMGLCENGDEVEGYLSAYEVLSRIKDKI